MNINSPVLAMQFKRFVSSRHFRNTVLPKLLSRLTPNKPRFIKLFLLVLFIEVSWIVVTVLQEMDNPTLYTSSMVKLSNIAHTGQMKGETASAIDDYIFGISVESL